MSQQDDLVDFLEEALPSPRSRWGVGKGVSGGTGRRGEETGIEM